MGGQSPNHARNNQDVERWINASPYPQEAQALIDDLGITDDRRARAAAALSGVSRSLSKAVRRDPSLLDVLDPPLDFASEKSLLHAPDDPDAIGGLRRWKNRQLLRIALRDLMGEADLATVGRELSVLADACLARALEIAESGPPLAIIGMGKLGGRELNYASDVDIVFVHEGDATAATRRARKVVETLAELTNEGAVFRIDTELRPEGRAGPLSRTPDAFGHYFDRWAQPWERQAYIKTRLSAGDPELGNAFFDAIKPGVWGENFEATTVPSVRTLKLLVEESIKAKGDREIKRGPGGLRDIEFTVQLLQMVHGRSDPTIRSSNTLTALRQLSWGDYIDNLDAAYFTTAYVHLRTVEHRLQLRDGRQTHELPSTQDDKEWLARAMGHENWAAFKASHDRHLTSVREIHQQIFYRGTLDRVHEIGVINEYIPNRLRELNYADPDQATATVERLIDNLARRAKVMEQVLVIMIEALASTPDPNLGLVRLTWLLDGSYRVTTILPVLRDSPLAISNLARLLGSSRVSAMWLRRHPEFTQTLANPAELAQPRCRETLTNETREVMQSHDDDHGIQMAELRRFVRREQLRVVTRDILGMASITDIPEELSMVADAAVTAATEALGSEVPFAVIGLGRYGGMDLSYASDLDVIFVFDGTTDADIQSATRTARGLLQEIGAQTAEGRAWEIDARLRPDGESGQIARSLEGYQRYYEERGQLWERQSLIKRRFVAGDPDLGQRFLELIDGWCYQPDFCETDVAEIRDMKRRIETERLGVGSKALNVKLGAGGLSDIEFTVQLLQLQHGFEQPALRDYRTLAAIDALAKHDLLDADDRATLDAGYRFCQRFRNARYHLSGRGSDVFPGEDHEKLLLARYLGYPTARDLEDSYGETTGMVREVTNRLFYGESD